VHGTLQTNTRVRRLKKLGLFARCSTKQLRRMEPLMTEAQVPAGRVLTSCAEPGAEFFVVVKGTASVWREGVQPTSWAQVGSSVSCPCSTIGCAAPQWSPTRTWISSCSPYESSGAPIYSSHPVMERMLEVVSVRLRRANEGWTGAHVSPRSSSDVPLEPWIPVPSLP
jgi:hypothetical protein